MMRSLLAGVAAALMVGSVAASAPAAHVPIRDAAWSLSKVHPAATEAVSLSFVLTRPRAAVAAELEAVSNPKSSRYLDYKSREEVGRMIEPAKAVLQEWDQYIAAHEKASAVKKSGVEVAWRHDQMPADTSDLFIHSATVVLSTTVQHAEHLLGHQIRAYQHYSNGARALRVSGALSEQQLLSKLVPHKLHASVAYVGGLVRFPITPVASIGNNKGELKPVKQMQKPRKHAAKHRSLLRKVKAFDQAGEAQLLSNVALDTSNGNFLLIASLVCYAPLDGGASWVQATPVTNPVTGNITGATCTPTGATAAATFVGFNVTISTAIGATGQVLGEYGVLVSSKPPVSLPTGALGYQITVPLPSNYDAYYVTITQLYKNADASDLLVTIPYPFGVSGTTDIYSEVVAQFLGRPDDVTGKATAESKAKVKQAIGSLYLSQQAPGFWNSTDLTSYYDLVGIDAAAEIPFLNWTDISNPPMPNNPMIAGGELTLDMTSMSSGNLGVTTDVLHTGSQTPFLDIAHACLLDPTITVLSFSYGGGEDSTVSPADTALAALGAAGVSVFVSSGDTGPFMSGFFGPSCGSFAASYPATSQYVTAVGATNLQRFQKNSCPIETTCSLEAGSIITSGGGFSAVTATPSWQTNALNAYLSSSSCPKPAQTLGYTTTNRAYPDISALGHNYPVFLNGKLGKYDGTSASSPVTAGLFASFYVMRAQYGEKPLGFLNPLLYSLAESDPDVFNDITIGSNRCLSFGAGCCPEGYSACPGFDPATGLGSINFQNMYKKLLPAEAIADIAPTVTNNYFPDCPNYVPKEEAAVMTQ